MLASSKRKSNETSNSGLTESDRRTIDLTAEVKYNKRSQALLSPTNLEPVEDPPAQNYPKRPQHGVRPNREHPAVVGIAFGEFLEENSIDLSVDEAWSISNALIDMKLSKKEMIDMVHNLIKEHDLCLLASKFIDVEHGFMEEYIKEKKAMRGLFSKVSKISHSSIPEEKQASKEDIDKQNKSNVICDSDLDHKPEDFNEKKTPGRDNSERAGGIVRAPVAALLHRTPSYDKMRAQVDEMKNFLNYAYLKVQSCPTTIEKNALLRKLFKKYKQFVQERLDEEKKERKQTEVLKLLGKRGSPELLDDIMKTLAEGGEIDVDKVLASAEKDLQKSEAKEREERKSRKSDGRYEYDGDDNLRIKRKSDETRKEKEYDNSEDFYEDDYSQRSGKSDSRSKGRKEKLSGKKLDKMLKTRFFENSEEDKAAMKLFKTLQHCHRNSVPITSAIENFIFDEREIPENRLKTLMYDWDSDFVDNESLMKLALEVIDDDKLLGILGIIMEETIDPCRGMVHKLGRKHDSRLKKGSRKRTSGIRFSGDSSDSENGSEFESSDSSTDDDMSSYSSIFNSRDTLHKQQGLLPENYQMKSMLEYARRKLIPDKFDKNLRDVMGNLLKNEVPSFTNRLKATGRRINRIKMKKKIKLPAFLGEWRDWGDRGRGNASIAIDDKLLLSRRARGLSVKQKLVNQKAIPESQGIEESELTLDYVAKWDISELFQSLLSSLLFHRPKTPVEFLHNLIKDMKKNHNAYVHAKTVVTYSEDVFSKLLGQCSTGGKKTEKTNAVDLFLNGPADSLWLTKFTEKKISNR